MVQSSKGEICLTGIDNELRRLILEADQEEARMITGLAEALSTMLHAKREATAAAASQVHALLFPNAAPRPLTEAELDAQFRGNLPRH